MWSRGYETEHGPRPNERSTYWIAYLLIAALRTPDLNTVHDKIKNHFTLNTGLVNSTAESQPSKIETRKLNDHLTFTFNIGQQGLRANSQAKGGLQLVSCLYMLQTVINVFGKCHRFVFAYEWSNIWEGVKLWMPSWFKAKKNDSRTLIHELHQGSRSLDSVSSTKILDLYQTRLQGYLQSTPCSFNLQHSVV